MARNTRGWAVARHQSAPRQSKRYLRAGAVLSWGAGLLTYGAVVLSLAAPACAAGESSQTPSRQEIIDAFQQRVFFVADSGEKEVVKWQVPVRFGLMSDVGVSPGWISVLANDIAEVQAATHHEMTVTTERINFLIVAMQDVEGELQLHRAQLAPFFVSDAEYQRFASAVRNPRAICGGKFLFSNQKTIIAYLLIVKTAPSYDQQYAQACLLTEIMKGVGLLRRRAGAKDVSVTAADERHFTEIDQLLLRLLYDPRIPGGTPEPQAMAILSKMVGSEH